MITVAQNTQGTQKANLPQPLCDLQGFHTLLHRLQFSKKTMENIGKQQPA